MVPYVVMLDDGAEVTVKNPSAFPPSSDREKCLEPMVEVRLVAPREYMSSILKLCLVCESGIRAWSNLSRA
jgi:GTP-binding protein LepA